MKKTLFTLVGLLLLVNLQAQNEILIPGLNAPNDIVIDGNTMYVATRFSVMKFDITEPLLTLDTLFTGLDDGAGLALKDGILYASDFSNGQIWKIDLTANNPAPEILISGLKSPNMMAIRGDDLYFSDNNENLIGRVSLVDPSPQLDIVASNLGNVIGIEIYEDQLFFAAISGTQSIRKINLTDANPIPEVIFANASWPQGLSKCGANIYVSSRDAFRVLRFNASCNSTVVDNVWSDIERPRQSLVHDGYIYVVSADEGIISRTPYIDPNCNFDIQEACESYTWIDGITYTSSNNSATYVIPTTSGCDSVITLNLTIGNNLSDIDFQTACDSYTWVDGITYTASSDSTTFTYALDNGCDSIVTLDLLINNSSTYTDAQTACSEYTWIDGNTYTQNNNTATFVLPNSNGCDSIITLALVINEVNADVIFSNEFTLMAVASGANYQWLDCDNNNAPIPGATDQSFMPNGNGNYAVMVTENNCTETSTCEQVIVTGIEETELLAAVSIAPNPTTGDLLIEFGDIKYPDLEVYSSMGELLKTYPAIDRSTYTLHLNEVAGVYFIMIRFGEVSRVYRVVKI